MSIGSSEMIPSHQLPYQGVHAMRLEKYDSSTCLAWEAYDAEHGGQRLFIKQLRPELYADKPMRNSFIKEYSIGSQLTSDYFPRYRSFNDDGEHLSITQNYIDGDTLETRLDQSPDYFRNKANLRRFIYQMLEALCDLHSASIIHLDLKPQNIIITRRTDNVRIIDFGYSCSDDWVLSLGKTTSFAAPELKSGNTNALCAASDIYSFGIIVQHIVAKSGVRLPKPLRRIINKCTQENIEDRYTNAQQIIEDLDAYYNSKKANAWLTIATSVAATLLLVISSISLYRYWYAEQFSLGGFSYRVYNYHGVNGVMITSADPEVVKDSTIRFPEQVTYHRRTYNIIAVGEKAFSGQENIRDIEFGHWMHEIDNNAFFGCPSLQSVHFTGNVRSIGNGAFASCPALDTFIVNKTNPWLYVRDSVLFSNEGKILRQCPATKKGEYTVPEGIMRVYNSAFQGCRQLTHITIPRSVIHLDSNAFQDCTSLKTVSIPSSTPELPNAAFCGCTSLESINLPEGVKQISWYVFNGCTSLSSVSIPSTCINIGPSFQGCNALSDIYNHRPTPQDISDDTFTHYGTLHVPAQSIAAYRNHPVWQKFKIVAMQ